VCSRARLWGAMEPTDVTIEILKGIQSTLVGLRADTNARFEWDRAVRRAAIILAQIASGSAPDPFEQPTTSTSRSSQFRQVVHGLTHPVVDGDEAPLRSECVFDRTSDQLGGV